MCGEKNKRVESIQSAFTSPDKKHGLTSEDSEDYVIYFERWLEFSQ